MASVLEAKGEDVLLASGVVVSLITRTSDSKASGASDGRGDHVYVRQVSLPVLARERDVNVEASLVDDMRRRSVRAVLAGNGAAEGRSVLGKVAAYGLMTGNEVSSGVVPRLDRTAGASETWASLLAVRAFQGVVRRDSEGGAVGDE